VRNYDICGTIGEERMISCDAGAFPYCHRLKTNIGADHIGGEAKAKPPCRQSLGTDAGVPHHLSPSFVIGLQIRGKIGR
jgi:hypothetical protein